MLKSFQHKVFKVFSNSMNWNDVSIQERESIWPVFIPVFDADGDTVRCRWAAGSGVECGDLCEKFPGALLDTVREA